MMYDITWEASGFTQDKTIIDREYNKAEIGALIADHTTIGETPEHIRSILGGYITEDDAQSTRERHVFVCVRMRCRYETVAEAENFPPEDLLNQIAEAMGRNAQGEIALSLEDGPWQVSSAEPIEDCAMRERPPR